MPAYSKTNWVDGSVPAIDATNLNKIEQGIFDSLRQDGSTTMSGQLVTTAGSAATPAIAPTGDANTGIFFPAADTIAFGEGGTEVMRLTSAGNLLIGTTTDYTSTEKAGSVTIDGYASRNVVVNTGASSTQPSTSLIIQNATPFNGGNGSVTVGISGIYSSPIISNDGSGGANAVTGNGTTSTPNILSSSSSARIALTCYTGNSIRNSVNDLSTNASNFLSGTQNSTGHGASLPNTAVTGIAVANQGTVTNNSGTITTSTAALFRNACGNAPAAQVNTVTTANGVNADLIVGSTTGGASSVTDYYAFRSTSIINASGTLTNFYGLHIGTPTVTGTLSNKWAIYSTDPNMKSYHAGNVGIGTTLPGAKLQTVLTDNSATTYPLIVNNENNQAGDGWGAGIKFSTGIPGLGGTEANKWSSVEAFDVNNYGANSGLSFTVSSNYNKSKAMVITRTGNVGIGTTSPATRLHVEEALTGSGGGGIIAATASSNGNAGIGFRTASTDVYSITTLGSAGSQNLRIRDVVNNATRVTLDSNGYFLIGYTSSNGAYPLQVNGQIFATSSTIATSDGRYKKDVVALDGALDIVKALNPVQFSWKDHPVHKFNTDVPTVGFIAQEVEQALADKSYLTSIIKKSECTWETETGETVEREVTRDVEKQVTREVEREITETIDGEEVTRTVTEEITETVIEQVTEIVIEPVKETHTEEFLGIAESNLIAILTKAVKELAAEVEALKAQLNK